MTASLDLAGLGADVLLIDKGPFLGGYAANLTCKATDRCLKCNDCLVEEKLKETSQQASFDIMRGTEAADIKKQGEIFHVSLRSALLWIDPLRCTGCGVCLDKCPEAARGAILHAPSHHLSPPYGIDPLKCSCLSSGEKAKCLDLCPEGAINLDEKETLKEVDVEAVVLATGYRPADPAEIGRFKVHRFRNMVTAMELEKMLRFKGTLLRPSDSASPESLAFIQCVGSRDEQLGHDYCSRVCCGYALRMASKLVYDHPDLDIAFFYMDIQNVCSDFDRFIGEARNRIRFIRGLPGDFYASEKDRVSIGYYDPARRKTLQADFDIVVLSVGLTPGPSHGFFRDRVGLSLDEDGFLRVPEGAENQGVFLAGTVEGPMDVSESISHAKRAVFQVGRYLGLC